MGLRYVSGPTLRALSLERLQPTLISLLDMQRFFAATFMSVTQHLEIVRNALITIDTFMAGQVRDADIAQEWESLNAALVNLKAEFVDMPLPVSLQGQITRAIDRAKTRTLDNVKVMRTIVEELQHNIADEMAEQLFFQVQGNLKWFYLTPEKLLGETCEAKFPDAVKDAHDGIRCYVLDQWTASVFHFMRTLEHGLRWLCKEVELENPDADLENWKNIIDQIEKKIKKMEDLPKSREKIEKLKFYSEAAVNFRHFKDAWRNHVSHARSNYDGRDARRVLTHVADFMKHLASGS
jgi:hypothetical protein